MTYLKKLLNGQKVEWKTLGEVVLTITAPTKVKREAYREAGKLPIIDQGIEFIAGYTDELLPPVELGEYVIFGDHSEHIKYVDFAFIQGADGLKILKSEKENTKYIYYAFTNFYRKELSYKRHWSNAKDTLIPIPPLSVQKEIVRILDMFTELIKQLNKELGLRKKQYEYYREKLLTFQPQMNTDKHGFDVEWKTLGEVLLPKGYIRGPFGSALKKEFFVTEGIPIYEQQHAIYDKRDFRYFINNKRAEALKRFQVKPNDLIISCSGTIGKISIIKKGDVLGIINQALLILRLNSSLVLVKYLKYYLECFPNLIISSSGGAINNIEKRSVIEKISIPIPPLSEQERIVSILDKFDTLVNSISEGLPKEIELRQKQYEYYRDLLLKFDNI